jgi:hypothetical protein
MSDCSSTHTGTAVPEPGNGLCAVRNTSLPIGIGIGIGSVQQRCQVAPQADRHLAATLPRIHYDRVDLRRHATRFDLNIECDRRRSDASRKVGAVGELNRLSENQAHLTAGAARATGGLDRSPTAS